MNSQKLLKPCLIITLCLAMVIFSINALKPKHSLTADPLIASFLATGAVCQEIRLAAWGKLADAPLNRAALALCTQNAATVLAPGLTRNFSQNNKDKQEVIYEGVLNNISYKLIGQNNTAGSYLFLTITALGDYHALPALKAQCLNALPSKAEINCLLIGTLPGTNPAILPQLFKTALKEGSVQKIAESRSGNHYSLSGYTKGLYPWVKAEGSKVNLQLAAALPPGQNPKIYAGSPLIFVDY